MKVLLILVDGMRPDALVDIPYMEKMKTMGSYTMDATTVFPSMTLPCHLSLFHSVDPMRHGTTTNTYAPQVRPIDGLFEVLDRGKKKSAMFYSWEQLRDVSRPGSISYSCLHRCRGITDGSSARICTKNAIEYIRENDPDFTFLYIHYPDDTGHREGWMGESYMKAIKESWEMIEKIMSTLPEDYTVLITADHGGHDRTHGLDIPEDMTIPMFFYGKDFKPGEVLHDVNLKDLAPTIAKLLDVETPEEWEGKSLV